MITSDWHIHSRNSCDQAALAVADLVSEAAAIGIADGDLWRMPPRNELAALSAAANEINRKPTEP